MTNLELFESKRAWPVSGVYMEIRKAEEYHVPDNQVPGRDSTRGLTQYRPQAWLLKPNSFLCRLLPLLEACARVFFQICVQNTHGHIHISPPPTNVPGSLKWYTLCILTFRHRASSILGQAFHYLIFAWPCIIDINNIDNQLDATITAY